VHITQRYHLQQALKLVARYMQGQYRRYDFFVQQPVSREGSGGAEPMSGVDTYL